MKKIIPFLSLFVLLSAFTCENEPLEGEFLNADGVDITDPDNTQAGNFQVDFDGQTFVADVISATILNGVMNITGLRGSDGESVILTISENNEVGTYQLGVTNGVQVNAAAYSEQNNSNNGTWIAATDGIESQGEVTITEIDQENETMSGTFFFTGNNPSLMTSKEFTNGVFTNVPYTGTLVSSDDNNTFFAKVDGEEFVEDAINGTYTDLAGMTTIAVVATKNNLETMSVTLPGDVIPGTYDFASLSIPNAQYNLGSTDINSGTGTVTITTHDAVNKKLIGTFQFTAAPLGGTGTSYEITEGSFDVTYL